MNITQSNLIVRQIYGLVVCLVVCLISSVGFAQLNDFTINRVSSDDEREALGDKLQMKKDNGTGFSIGLGWDTEDYQKPDEIIGAETLESNQFFIGEYAIMCFTPEKDMFVRLFDTKPTGKTLQLYPRKNEAAEYMSAEVKATFRYCIGDSKSDVRVYADEKSGTGKGVLYLIGVEDEADFPDLDSIGDIPPGWEFNGLGWDTEDVADSIEFEEEEGVTIYEAYYKYEILEKTEETN